MTTPTNLDDLNFLEVTRVISQTFPIASACAAVQGSFFRPPPALPSTAEEIRRGLDCINRQIYVNSLVEHSAGSMVEYQETGTSKGVAVAHRFSVDPLNFSTRLVILMAENPTSIVAVCSSDAKGIQPLALTENYHPALRLPLDLDALGEAKKEIFSKTLGFHCTLAEKGCCTELTDDDSDPESDSESDSDESESETRTTKLLDPGAKASLRCEHHKKTDKAHLILRTLDEFDITYLRALLENDTRIIDEREELARIGKTLTGIAPPENWHAGYFSDQKSLLLDLDWKLADATPRKLMIDSGFMSSFRRALGWKKPFDPPLAALHPSLGNLDHLVIALLMRSKKLSLDTAFKRLKGKWQEFEMETWELDRMKSLIGTRAFTTSQSAQAHLILFTRIFEIAQGDTGTPCRFRHIHGEGFELWITDSHKGQALGEVPSCHITVRLRGSQNVSDITAFTDSEIYGVLTIHYALQIESGGYVVPATGECKIRRRQSGVSNFETLSREWREGREGGTELRRGGAHTRGRTKLAERDQDGRIKSKNVPGEVRKNRVELRVAGGGLRNRGGVLALGKAIEQPQHAILERRLAGVGAMEDSGKERGQKGGRPSLTQGQRGLAWAGTVVGSRKTAWIWTYCAMKRRTMDETKRATRSSSRNCDLMNRLMS
ncbi:hypothetical protein DFH09DRAFT_1478222 [Mycena vulgaris]|nr:hypothetical protein DFH09DRAFT_1478222 [Mycena vulgaris]